MLNLANCVYTYRWILFLPQWWIYVFKICFTYTRGITQELSRVLALLIYVMNVFKRVTSLSSIFLKSLCNCIVNDWLSFENNHQMSNSIFSFWELLQSYVCWIHRRIKGNTACVTFEKLKIFLSTNFGTYRNCGNDSLSQFIADKLGKNIEGFKNVMFLMSRYRSHGIQLFIYEN